ncbi:MAG: hypothetical protein ACRD0K_10085 [Egibacteraceae bacterium]
MGRTAQAPAPDNGTTLTFNEGKAKLTPEVTNNAAVLVLTFRELRRNVETRMGPANVIITDEYPDHGFYANVTSLRRIAALYGNDYSKWTGRQIVLVMMNVQRVGTTQMTNTYWAADTADDAEPRYSWARLLKEATRRSKAAAK